jgi:hypothetical protein
VVPTHDHHENHHRLNTERAAAFRSTPARNRIRRRELAKAAVWSLQGHLRCCHGSRGVGLLTLAELEAMHAAYHERLTEP